MPRMLDLIRSSQVPSNMMQWAARGALSVPPEETIEILVYLALHHKLFGDQARMTLAGWDERASIRAAGDPKTSAEVLGYFVSAENLRPALLPALAENPAVPEEALDKLAATGSRSVLEELLKSKRVTGSRSLLQALRSNAHLHANEAAEIDAKLSGLEATATANVAPEADIAHQDLDETVTKYLEENAAELAAEKDSPYHAIGLASSDTALSDDAVTHAEPATATATSDSPAASAEKPGTDGKSPAAAAVAAKLKKPALAAAEQRRDSTLQKISKLDIKGRIALAMRGSKEERSILIRDSTKLVAIAVLESPKVSDGEVESFAQQKNVLESVLRAIPMKRRFVKNYNITRNLVYNPRTPLDVSLGLIKNLLIHDLKNLSGNKEVSDTVRKLALRLFKQRLEKKG